MQGPTDDATSRSVSARLGRCVSASLSSTRYQYHSPAQHIHTIDATPLSDNMSANDVPEGVVSDNDYVSRTGQKDANIPVTSDNEVVENDVSRDQADSDAQLGR